MILKRYKMMGRHYRANANAGTAVIRFLRRAGVTSFRDDYPSHVLVVVAEKTVSIYPRVNWDESCTFSGYDIQVLRRSGRIDHRYAEKTFTNRNSLLRYLRKIERRHNDTRV